MLLSTARRPLVAAVAVAVVLGLASAVYTRGGDGVAQGVAVPGTAGSGGVVGSNGGGSNGGGSVAANKESTTSSDAAATSSRAVEGQTTTTAAAAAAAAAPSPSLSTPTKPAPEDGQTKKDTTTAAAKQLRVDGDAARKKSAGAAGEPQAFRAYLVVAIMSGPHAFERRAAQRATTVSNPRQTLELDDPAAAEPRLVFVHRFIIGKATHLGNPAFVSKRDREQMQQNEKRLRDEMLEYGDIIEVDVKDNRGGYSLMHKRWAAIAWAARSVEERGAVFSALVQLDDDCIAHLPRIVEYLRVWTGELALAPQRPSASADAAGAADAVFVRTNETISEQRTLYLWGNYQNAKGPSNSVIEYITGFTMVHSQQLVSLVYRYRDRNRLHDQHFFSHTRAYDDVANGFWVHVTLAQDDVKNIPFHWLSNAKPMVSPRGRGIGDCHYFVFDCGGTPTRKDDGTRVCPSANDCSATVNHVASQHAPLVYEDLDRLAHNAHVRRTILLKS